MKIKTVFYASALFLPIILSILPVTGLKAQTKTDRELNVAVNGFSLNEPAAKNALARGGDINQVDDAMGGETMLITAVKGFKDPNVFRFLIENGADTKIKDRTGKTALDWALQYNYGRNNNGREILKLLGNAPAPGNTNNNNNNHNNTANQNTTNNATANNAGPNRTTRGGPSIADIKRAVEKHLTSSYENHFYGVKNEVSFEWSGGIIVGQPENRLYPTRSCYPVKLNVKATIVDPRDGNTTTISRGTNALIGGFRRSEIFCFFKNGFGDWDLGTYEP